MIAPQGRICGIVDTLSPLDLNALKPKSASFVWEFMFTKSMFQTEDMISQHRLLAETGRMVDEGVVKTTVTETLAPINAENLREAHRMIEAGHMIGKVVLEGF